MNIPRLSSLVSSLLIVPMTLVVAGAGDTTAAGRSARVLSTYERVAGRYDR